jgi:hypothetical protein
MQKKGSYFFCKNIIINNFYHPQFDFYHFLKTPIAFFAPQKIRNTSKDTAFLRNIRTDATTLVKKNIPTVVGHLILQCVKLKIVQPYLKSLNQQCFLKPNKRKQKYP